MSASAGTPRSAGGAESAAEGAEAPDATRLAAARLAERTRVFASDKDVDEFVAVLERYERGEMDADEFKRFRLVRGIYGQRQQGTTQMVRCKIPQGVLLPHQLERMADLCERYSRGFGHVTTRQNMQFHFVALANIEAFMRGLAEVGLTTREACGNSVRNVTACEFAGVCAEAPFDVTPYGEAITRYFLRREPFYDLPRKFKIALSGCAHLDCAQAAMHDIGLTALVRDGVRGFRVRVGGALSTRPFDAMELCEFVPADELLVVCEAVLWVFHRHGNRKNKAKARMKFVIIQKGWEFFRAEYDKALAEVRARTGGKVPIESVIGPLPGDDPPAPPPVRAGNGAAAPPEWAFTNVRRQRQSGYLAVTLRLRRGDVTAEQMRALARVAREYTDGEVRTQSNDQNMVLRWVPQDKLGALYRELAAAGLGNAGAHTIHDVTACPGAETCQLAYTHSRDLALDIGEALARADGRSAAVAAAADQMNVKISGCPNSCGRHHIATLGWHGGVKRVGQGVVPVYQLHLGGRVDARGATFGRTVVKIPARRVSEAVLRLVALYAGERAGGESAASFFDRLPDERVKDLLADLARIDESNVTPEDYVDLGQQENLKVEIGPGECAT